MVVMVAPFAPHFAEENWERLGHSTSIFEARWPTWDERLTVQSTVELVVQVNGKTRSKVHVPRDSDEATALAAALADPAVQRFLDGKQIRKTILVPNRLLNLVVG
jgi:leucyl-tRNA synthetase